MRDAGEIESAITAFARAANGGLIVTGSPLRRVHRDLIVALAAQHIVCPLSTCATFVAAGGLCLYGPTIEPVPPRGWLR